MSYFRRIPNVEYQSFLSDSKSSGEYIIVKNLFKRMKLRDDLQNVLTIFDKYKIPDGSRPDLIAEEFYGSSEYDFIVLICAGITNYRDEWPLSNYELYNYCLDVYGSEQEMYSVHHYETIEIKDSNENLILPKGKIVNKDFKIFYSDNGKIYTNDNETIQSNVVNIQRNIVNEITNFEYESKKNEEKRTIYLLKPEYLQQALIDMNKELLYSRSSEYVNQNLIRTENTKAIGQ